jgi:hypothetical protein
VQRHPAGGRSVHGGAARADHQISVTGEDGIDEETHLRRVVGPIRLHEDNGARAAGSGLASARKAGESVAAPRFVQQRRAGRSDQFGAAVGLAVVHEQRAPEQAEAAQLGQQRRQGRSLVEHRHDDEVVWAL